MSEHESSEPSKVTTTRTVHLGYDDLAGWRVRSYLSKTHVETAYFFAEQSAEIEQEYARKQRHSTPADAGSPPEQMFERHKAYVVGCVFAVVAFLEALINETLSDADENPDPHLVERFNADELHSLASLWGVVKSRQGFPFLDKYQLALITLRKRPFDVGELPYQDVDLVRQLRNSLIHFQPEWFVGRRDYQDVSHIWEKRMRGKRITPNPFAAPKAPYFPSRMLGYGCAKWASDSCTRFADEFFGRLGVAPRYESGKAD